MVRGPCSVGRETALWLASLALAAGVGAQTRLLDDFATVNGWNVAPSEGVTLAVAAVEAVPAKIA